MTFRAFSDFPKAKKKRAHSLMYLQIPLDTIGSLCLKPRKYLLFLGWCILGVEGALALDRGGSGIDTNGGLDNQEIYYYVTAADSGTFFITVLHAIAHIACAHGDLCCLTQIFLTLSIPRSSRRGRTRLRKRRRCAKTFAPVYWNMMLDACGQELVQTMAPVCILFPSSGVPKCVLQSCAGKISDLLLSGFGSSWRIVQVAARMSESYMI
jgi:hypothetical protein